MSLVLTIRKFHDDNGRVRFDWNLRSNGQIVSTSHRQGYSRRIDCARGAEVGAGLCFVVNHLRDPNACLAYRHGHDNDGQIVEVRLIDERGPR